MILYRWLSLAWIIFTLLVLGVPSNALPSSPFPIADKVVHALIFACGSLIACRGWPKRLLWVITLLLLFAIFAEGWQHIIPTDRHVDSMDTFANILGVILGSTLALSGLRAKRRP